MIDSTSRGRLDGWKSLLLDLSADDPLLDAIGDRVLALPGLDPAGLAAALAAGSTFVVESGVESSADAGRLRSPISVTELERRLVAMRRSARASLADGGAHTLWLALGLLHWSSPEGATHAAPLWLVPIRIEDVDGALRVAGCDAVDARFNHALGEKLRRDFDVLLESTDELAAVLASAEGIAVTRPGWRVERGVRLGVFSLAHVTMWRDLEARGDSVLESPVIAHLAEHRGVAFPQPSAEAAGAVTAAPGVAHDLLAPLDADASQLAAVGAAAAGASFVLQGPPGTGKSQTIANLIVDAVARGKTVLFASTKVAALEVVQQRLAAVGLGEFCLALQAHEAGRARVVQQLAHVLERAFRPGGGPSGDDTRLAELRAALDGHVKSLHRIGPFGRSLHDVLGRLVELRTTPRAELADRDATGLDAGTFERRCAAVTRLAETAGAVEPVLAHPWQRSTRTHWVATDRVDVLAALDEAGAAGAALGQAVGEVAALVPGLVARTRDQLVALGTMCGLAAVSPRPGAELLTHLRSAREDELGEQIALIRARGTGVVEPPRDPLAYLALAHRHRGLVIEVEDRFTERVAELDAHAQWAQLRKWTASLAPVRFVALRSARAAVRAVAMPAELATDDAMINALEAVIAERACRAALVAAAEPAKRWFGELHCDDVAQLDLAKLDAAVRWSAELRKAFDTVDVSGGDAGRTTAWRALVAQVAASPDAITPSAFALFADCAARWAPALTALAEVTGIAPPLLGAGEDHLALLHEQVETLAHSVDALHAWVEFHAARGAALAAGAGPAVAAIERGDLAASELAGAWERATLLAWSEAELAETPALARFHGATHHAHVAAFADLDRATLALVRSRALARLAERVPRVSVKAAEADPELAAMLHAAKHATAMPLRALLAQIPNLLSQLAPCVLATPLAVAEYLDPAHARFDLVVFDEASQLATPEALGVLARANAAVVVGDSRQLRPTNGLPSFLDACVAARLPELSLGWHYRSKHEDLIAFANRRFYDDRLQVFPTAAPRVDTDSGIAWRAIEGEGGDAIVADVLARVRDPQQRARSIAVVTSSPEQAVQIEDALDAQLSADARPLEPVLVRHVDAIQGEERDVVLLALTGTLDERQLAVATTRAREQLVVFSADRPDELVAFARAGGAARPSDDQPPASPITDAIARALGERGWIVRHQVGCGAYKIDLAIVDPNDSERHVLAIELDGGAYASAYGARDRDRLRAQILGQLGWRLHRVWSLDYWLEPEREIQRAHGAIVTAIAASRQRRSHSGPVPVKARGPRASGPLATPVVHIPPLATPEPLVADATTGAALLGDTRPNLAAAKLAAGSAPIRLARGVIPIGPYTVAAIPAGRRAPDDMFAPRYLPELGKVVEQVLAAEAPMHVDLLARRVGGYFGIGRVTQRVSEQVRVALAGRGRWGDEDNVVWRMDQDPAGVPPVRVAGHGPSARREIEEVPLSELAAAARIVVERAPGVPSSELVRDAARLLGFARITDRVIDRVALGVELAQIRTLITITEGRAKLPE